MFEKNALFYNLFVITKNNINNNEILFIEAKVFPYKKLFICNFRHSNVIKVT